MKKYLDHPARTVVAMTRNKMSKRVWNLRQLGARRSGSRLIDIELRMFLFLLGKYDKYKDVLR